MLVERALFPPRLLPCGLALLGLTGCSEAPSQDILGSYFPSWMLCALCGLILAVVAKQVFASIGVDEALPVPLLVYLALAIAFAFATWLAWLG